MALKGKIRQIRRISSRRATTMIVKIRGENTINLSHFIVTRRFVAAEEYRVETETEKPAGGVASQTCRRRRHLMTARAKRDSVFGRNPACSIAWPVRNTVLV